MKESNDNSLKVSNYWKKALYSSVVLGAFFVGGQYVSTVHASADTTQKANQPVPSKVIFDDVANNNNLQHPIVKGYVGQQSSLVNAKIRLQDLGYDVSNIPDTYTPTGSDAKIYSVTPIGVKNEPSTLSGQYKLIFEIKDQNGNYIESKYDSTNNSDNYDSTAIVNELKQEKDKFTLNGNSTDNGKIDTPSLQTGDNVITVSVTAPTHTLSINYVNQNNVTVFKTTRQVTNYGHTNFYDDQKNFGEDNAGIQINSDQPYVANDQSTATVNVTTNQAFQIPTDPTQVGSYNYAFPDPDDVTTVSDANGSQNPNGDAYYTTVSFVGADGKNIVSLIVGSNQSQTVRTENLDPDDSDYDSLIDFDNVTDLPANIDLTKGPYTFHSTDTLSGLQAAQSSAAAQSQAAAEQQAASSAQASQSTSSSVPVVQQSSAQPTSASATPKPVPSAQSSQSSAPQQTVEPAKSSAQPAPTPAPVVQSHSSAAPVASTAKSTPAPAPKPTPAPAPKPVVKPTPQPAKPVAKAKPTKTQLKAITKSFKQAKHAVKSDTAKLKAMKKKMKKHATKKQKAAYKKLQTKLAAEKKAFNSVKTQEGKLSKYFKSVATIGRDNKQIKSLTAQMKKLKKKHSKASKKKYSKDKKALKKANNSLKAATKFVKNYK
ncbi:hypothetical protein [Apilactobacillus kunkeei]|uniref:Uncharacterized protein n=1 Tax=Apilactobacillus kunkeei TaxID=148814 RepID=A0A0P7L631_9LACO|nr:hypothetical protein [Apilactobacillus kunkeei]KPN84137.1 hypothetical protein RZ78_04200 [Apilactobacillus kunkeei]